MNIDNLFTPHPSGGIMARIPTKSGKLILSALAGYYYYSTPKENLDKASEYTAFELAIFNSDTGKWASYNEAKQVLSVIGTNGEYDKNSNPNEPQYAVIGWVDRSLLIRAIEEC